MKTTVGGSPGLPVAVLCKHRALVRGGGRAGVQDAAVDSPARPAQRLPCEFQPAPTCHVQVSRQQQDESAPRRSPGVGRRERCTGGSRAGAEDRLC